jgi:hypothetical protein
MFLAAPLDFRLRTDHALSSDWTKVNAEGRPPTKQQAVRPCWQTDASGQVMSVKFD